jgi:hypothetical protein
VAGDGAAAAGATVGRASRVAVSSAGQGTRSPAASPLRLVRTAGVVAGDSAPTAIFTGVAEGRDQGKPVLLLLTLRRSIISRTSGVKSITTKNAVASQIASRTGLMALP